MLTIVDGLRVHRSKLSKFCKNYSLCLWCYQNEHWFWHVWGIYHRKKTPFGKLIPWWSSKNSYIYIVDDAKELGIMAHYSRNVKFGPKKEKIDFAQKQIHWIHCKYHWCKSVVNQSHLSNVNPSVNSIFFQTPISSYSNCGIAWTASS